MKSIWCVRRKKNQFFMTKKAALWMKRKVIRTEAFWLFIFISISFHLNNDKCLLLHSSGVEKKKNIFLAHFRSFEWNGNKMRGKSYYWARIMFSRGFLLPFCGVFWIHRAECLLSLCYFYWDLYFTNIDCIISIFLTSLWE